MDTLGINLETYKTLIWLFIVASIGGFIGFTTKSRNILNNKPLYKKVYILFVSIMSSIFIAYITFELLYSSLDNKRLAIAIAGFAAFSGTDLLFIIQERFIEKIKDKIDRL